MQLSLRDDSSDEGVTLLLRVTGAVRGLTTSNSASLVRGSIPMRILEQPGYSREDKEMDAESVVDGLRRGQLPPRECSRWGADMTVEF